MQAEVKYQGIWVGDIKGETVKELIEDNYDIFKKYILRDTGNAAGYTLEKAWIERVSDDKCEFHVITHGDDNLINYDPTNDKSKEIYFDIFELRKEDFFGRYDFEIVENKSFSPFDDDNFSDLSFVVGMLEATIDFLSKNTKAYYSEFNQNAPSQVISIKYPTMRKNNLPMYISQIMTQFSFYNVKKTTKNNMAFELIERCNNTLVDFLKNSSNYDINASRILSYSKTKRYFDRLGKITALQYYRKKSGKTQQEVANAVGISLRQYQRYESINSTLGDTKQAIIEKIAETVGVEAKDIVSMMGIVVTRLNDGRINNETDK